MSEDKRDLWWVKVDVAFSRHPDEQRHFILAPKSPVNAKEAARLGCVYARRTHSLPNGEYPDMFTATTYEKRGGIFRKVEDFTYLWRGPRSVYWDGRLVGGEMEWENPMIGVVGFNWKHNRWDNTYC